MYVTRAACEPILVVAPSGLNVRSSLGQTIEFSFVLNPWYLCRFVSGNSVLWRVGTSASNPSFTRGRQLVSFWFEITKSPPCVRAQTKLNLYIYSEYVVNDSSISDIWTRDTNIWRVNESYVAGTIEYIWYVTVLHNVIYILNATLKGATTPTQADKTPFTNFAPIPKRLTYLKQLMPQPMFSKSTSLWIVSLYLECVYTYINAIIQYWSFSSAKTLTTCSYKAVNFVTNIHKIHPVGRGMGCPLWIQHLIDILP